MPIFFLILLIFSTSCKQNSSESELHITNGVLDDNEYPAVVQIHTEADGSCTGTFIRGNVLLTAAHCVIEGQIEGQPVVIESLTSKPKSTDIFIHKRFETDERVDAALVFFSEQLSLSPRELEFTKPKVGEKVTFVGYGKNAYFEDGTSTGSGEKRVGRNNIVAFVENFFRIIGTPHAQPSPEGPTGENSSLGMGDSGGPAFNDDRNSRSAPDAPARTDRFPVFPAANRSAQCN